MLESIDRDASQKGLKVAKPIYGTFYDGKRCIPEGIESLDTATPAFHGSLDASQKGLKADCTGII